MAFSLLLLLTTLRWALSVKLTSEIMEEARVSAQAKSTRRVSSDLPNFIVIFPDDFGWNDAYYTEGLTPYETENIDALANYGTKLSTYYSAPGCVAARCAILTGRNTLRNGCHEAAGPTGDKYWALNLNEILIPEILKTSDYYSALYGKWHLGFYSWQHHPMLRGFDDFHGFISGDVGHYDHINNDNIYDWWNGTNIDTGAMGTYQPFIVKDLIYDLIVNRGNGTLKKPFFAMLPMLLPHPNFEAPESYYTMFEDEWGEGSDMTMWLSELAVLDDLVGNIFQYCQDAQILENTYIIFAGDHAAENYYPEDVPHSRSYPFYGSKGQIWEGGIRTPAFIYNPSMTGLEISSPTSVTDWLPTIAELAGIQSYDLPYLDGISLVSLWENGEDENNEDRMLLVNVDPDCGGCDGRRRLRKQLKKAKEWRSAGYKQQDRRRDEEDGEEEEKDRGPSAGIRWQDYKLLINCMDWSGGIDGDVYFFDLSENVNESNATNYYNDGFEDSEMEDTFNEMLSALQEYAMDGYPNCPAWNEGVWCPDCENYCGNSTVDGHNTVRPWATCSPVYVGGGLEIHYVDEDYAWECESYCTEAYGGEIPEGVTFNRAEQSRRAQTSASSTDISAIIGVTLGVAVIGFIVLAFWCRNRRAYKSLNGGNSKIKENKSLVEGGGVQPLATQYGAASGTATGNQNRVENRSEIEINEKISR